MEPNSQKGKKQVGKLFSLQCHRTLSISPADYIGQFCVKLMALQSSHRHRHNLLPNRITAHPRTSVWYKSPSRRLPHKPPSLRVTEKEAFGRDCQAREKNLTITNCNTSFFNCQNTEIMLRGGFGARGRGWKMGWCNGKLKSTLHCAKCISRSACPRHSVDVNLSALDTAELIWIILCK